MKIGDVSLINSLINSKKAKDHPGPEDMPNKIDCGWKCGDTKTTTTGECTPDKALNFYHDGTMF